MDATTLRCNGLRRFGNSGRLLMLAMLLASAAIATTQAQQPASNAAYSSPRATVRTFLRAAGFARESPKYIKAAVACLDMEGQKAGDENNGLLATHLEAILRSRDIDTDAIPESFEDSQYVVTEIQGSRVALRRNKDGRWLFDRETIAQVPKMFAEVQKQLQERNREAAALNISLEFVSARATFRTLLKALYRGDRDTVLQCLDLDEVPAVARPEVGLRVANRLKQIMLRHKLVVYQEMPDTNFSDPYLWLSQPEGVIELVRRPSGEHKGQWVFSRATVRSINDLFDAFEDKPYLPEVSRSKAAILDVWQAPELWLRQQLPEWLKVDLIDTAGVRVQMYEAIGFGLLLFLAYGIAWATTHLLVLLVGWRVGARHWPMPHAQLARRLRWTGRFVGLVLLRCGVLALVANKTVLIGLLTVINPLFLLLLMLAIGGVIDLIGDLLEAQRTAATSTAGITQMLWPVASLVIKIALLLGTAYRLMAIFSWDVSTLLAGLGIGGLAFALGAQDSLKNLFGSFTLIADRPFVVGETVRIGTEGVGKVEFVGLRSTRIRTADDTLLIVPNSNLTTMNIINYGRRRYHHYETKISIMYSTPLERVAAFRDGIRELIRQQPSTRKDHFEVAITDLGSTAIVVQVEVYFEAGHEIREADARDALILAILRLAEQQQVHLTLPAQSVLIVPPRDSVADAAAAVDTAEAEKNPRGRLAAERTGYTTSKARRSA